MSNTEIWDKLRTPPQSALKPIRAGRLKGKTDISPQWRYQAMTEQFGPIGVGWYYEPVRTWTEPGDSDQVMVFAEIRLYIKHADEWSKPIYGTGGSMLIVSESRGLHSSDEAYKMATTDALSVAMKMLGVAADVYMGSVDGSKYSSQEQHQTAPSQPEPPKTKMADTSKLTPQQRKMVGDLCKKCEVDPKAVKEWVYRYMQIRVVDDSSIEEVCNAIQNKTEAIKTGLPF